MSEPSSPSMLQPTPYNVAGVQLNVWGMERLSPNREVAAMFLLHGRTSSKEDMERHVHNILPSLWKKDFSDRTKDLIIITLDHRNHGARTVDASANESFKKNPRHAIDMYAIQTGTAIDVAHLVAFLPAYLFPEATNPGGSRVTTWICAGVSLGGHSTWLAGTKHPRISHLIPIIGSPNYAALLRARAQEEGLAFTAPHWPRALDALVRTCDPVNLPLDFWAGKRILAICGGRDTLVPAKEGGTLDFVNALQGRGMGDRAKVLIDEAAGHEVTPQMLEWVVDWVWDSAMNEK